LLSLSAASASPGLYPLTMPHPGRYWHRKRVALLLPLLLCWSATALAHRPLELPEATFQSLLASSMLSALLWIVLRPWFPSQQLFALAWFSRDPADPLPTGATHWLWVDLLQIGALLPALAMFWLDTR
jgi:hypothetical protein